AKQAQAKGRTDDYSEITNKFRKYPQDDLARPMATHPTMLGNIIAEYESYPFSRYGIDSIFYWPRLWLVLDNDERERIDSGWSVAAGLLFVSATAFVGGLYWIFADLSNYAIGLFRHHPVGSPVALFDFLWLFLGYAAYRVSLPYHRANGEIFKS